MMLTAEIKICFDKGVEKEEHQGCDDTWVRPHRTWAKRREEALRAEEGGPRDARGFQRNFLKLMEK